MAEVPIPALQDAIRNLHGCGSRFVESVPVHETFNGATVWQGTVQVFDLLGHPSATRAYAWSHAVARDDSRRFVVVLHGGRIDSPLAAVRAAIVSESRKSVP
jgi:hypothetical protein